MSRPPALADGERVELDLRPHGRALVQPVLVLLAGTFLASYAYFAVPADLAASRAAAVRWGIFLLGGGALARWAGVPFLRWRTTTALVTDRRILVRAGLLGRLRRDVPLSAVTDVVLSRGLLDRLLGSGTLSVSTAGRDPRGPGAAPPPLVLHSVPRACQVRRQLAALAHTRQRPDDGRAPAGPTAPVSTLRPPGRSAWRLRRRRR